MSRHHGEIAFTKAVSEAQSEYGSRGIYGRRNGRDGETFESDPLSDAEREFIAERDSSISRRSARPDGPTCNFVAGHRASFVFSMTVRSAGPTSAAICNTSVPAISRAMTASR